MTISSYSPFKEGGNHVITSFIERFRERTIIPVSVSVEYLDCESSPLFPDWVNWLKSLFRAYDTPPRMVVLIGGEVWAAYRKCCPENWKDIPVVMGGMKAGFIDYENWSQGQVNSVLDLPSFASTFDDFKVSGYYLKDYFEENIQLIRILQPEVTDIAFYYDDRYDHRFLKAYIESVIHKFPGFKLHYWVGSSLTTSNLLDSLFSYDQNLVALSAGWYSDVNHYSHAYSRLQNELAVHTDKMIYEVMDQDFKTLGNMGGYFVSGVEIGSDLADLAYKVMTEGIGDTPIWELTPSAPRYHLNYATFIRRGFDEKIVPGEVVWHNHPKTFWQEYKTGIVISLIFFLMILIILSLLWRYRWRKEQNYIETNQKLQKLLKAMPDMAVIYDAKERITDIINPNRIILMGFQPEQFIGHTMAEIEKFVPGFTVAARKIGDQVNKAVQGRETSSFNYQINFENKDFYAEMRMVLLDEDKVICFVHDITSRIFVEKEVEKYKNFLQQVIEHLPVGIFVKNVSDNYRYIYYNQGVASFYEKDVNELLGKNDFEIKDPLALQYQAEDQEVLQNDHPISYNREFIDHKGEKHWAVTTKTKLEANDGFLYVLAILVDTTRIRKNEAELESIKNELSIALDAGNLSVWNYDVEKQLFTSLYQRTIAQFGLTYEKADQIVHPDDREKYRSLMNDLIAGKSKRRKEILRFNREGYYQWFETHAVAIPSDRHDKVYRVVGTEKNITEEVRRQQELQESKIKTELVIKSNGILQWDYDVQTEIFSSPTEESLINKSTAKKDFLEWVYPEDVHLVVEALQKVITNQVAAINLQVRIKYPDKDYRWIDIHAIVFQRDETGGVKQITGLGRDITDWKNVTEELILLRDKAEESNRLKTAFLANMSHEIRTPLNAIVGFSNLITQTENPKEIEEYCQVIEANNDLLLQLINDILDLSKIEAGQLEFAYTDVFMSEIFTNLHQIYQLRVKKGVQLICELPEKDCRIQTERNRLTQVISNFLTNACKFTFQGTIRMGYTYLEEGLRFYVSDTGKGIDPENLPHVFDRFMKFDAFVQGTGLGLSICKTIVNRLGGEIGVSSELGKGSEFWFTIPCKVNLMEETGGSVQKVNIVLEQTNSLPTDNASQELILVAEDNDSNYLLLSSILKKDYMIRRARDGKEAVHLYHELHPVLILMDIRMPEMDGLEATIQIRKTDSQIPIIALTANAFDEDREKALSAGCTEYLAKPVNIVRLQELLAQFLHGKGQPEETIS